VPPPPPPPPARAPVPSSSDLAGSERVKTSGAQGIRFSELKAINLSLTALGNCISALSLKKKHIPFRDSKLTRLLQNSLGGNAKTALVINVGPAAVNCGETYSSLLFGQRAMSVETRVRQNVDIDYKALYVAGGGGGSNEWDACSWFEWERMHQ
jgi:hypothetical protein